MTTPSLHLTTLGAFSLRCNGHEVVGLGNGKMAALLAYLATQTGAQRRETLAELLWPDTPMESARLNLRQTLFNLRNLLQAQTGAPVVRADRYQVTLEHQCALQTDLAAFVQATPIGIADDTQLAAYSAAIALYTGPFLGNIDLRDSPGFMEWLQLKRESLHRRALDVLRHLIEEHAKRGHTRTALSHALRYQELEPWSEFGYLWGMQLYAKEQQRDAALALFETGRRVLQHDLGVTPSEEMQLLAERLRRDNAATRWPASKVSAPLQEERRQVTVLYCALHAREVTDPEEAMERLHAPRAQCTASLQAAGGHVVQALEGGLLAYFGYPQACENTALHALRAALRLTALGTPDVDIRVGAHSGVVLTTGDLHRPDAIGTVSGMGIQLQGLASHATVIVSAETRARVNDFFRFTSLGTHRLPGTSAAIDVFRLEEAYGVSHRLDGATQLTPLVGREDSLRTLDRIWSLAHGGTFQSLLMDGEPGIGKSRIVRHLADKIGRGGNIVYELRCFPENQQTPMYPVIEAYRTMAGFQAHDTPDAMLGKLELLLQRRAPGLAQRALPLLARLLELPCEASSTLPPEQLASALSATITDLLLGVAARSPVLLVLEDIHWADASTLALITQLCARQPAAPILVLMSARTGFNADGITTQRLTLPPLETSAIETMVGALRKDLSPGQLAQVIARADGVPLYAEELAALSVTSELPTNLLDLLTVRLDSLGNARPLAQLASCVGREFEQGFLATVSELPPPALNQAVQHLVASGLVQRLPQQRLQFKHALVQEAAYQSQPRALRMATHRRIAHALQEGPGDLVAHQPEVLAHHWSAAGEAARAVPLWLAAGRHAAWSYAFHEAASHYGEGLALIPKLPPSPERDKLEFSLLVNLAHAEQVLAGYGNARAMALMERAFALLDSGVGDGLDRFHALWGLWEATGSRDGHSAALRVARTLCAAADAENQPALQQQAHYALGNSLFWTGALAQAHTELQRCIALEDRCAKLPVRDFYGRPIPMAARGYLACIRWLQGDTPAAQAMMDEALALASQQALPFDQAFASTFAATLRRWQGDVAGLAQVAIAGLAQATICQSGIFVAMQKMNLAWVAAMNGDMDALQTLEHAINAGRQSWSGAAVAILAPFAEALLCAGRFAQALSVLDDAISQARLKQDHHYLPELHRLQGECQWALGQPHLARQSFATALALGTDQGAVAFTLRARTSLLKLEPAPLAAPHSGST